MSKKKKKSSRKAGVNQNSHLHVTGGKQLTTTYLNAFFSLFSVKHIFLLEELYLELKPNLDKLYISGEVFMHHAKEAYLRYQEYKQLDAFQPMDNKGFEYVEKSLRKIIAQTIKENSNHI